MGEIEWCEEEFTAELVAELMSERNRQSPNLNGSSAQEFLSPSRCHRARAASGLEFIHSFGVSINGSRRILF